MKKHCIFSLTFGVALFLTSCNNSEPVGEAGSSLTEQQISEAMGLLKTDSETDATTALQINQTESFQELVLFLKNHRIQTVEKFNEGLIKNKRGNISLGIFVKDFEKNQMILTTDFFNKLKEAKTDKDKINAYSYIFEDPNEVFAFHDRVNTLISQIFKTNEEFRTMNKWGVMGAFNGAFLLQQAKDAKNLPVPLAGQEDCFYCGVTLNAGLDALNNSFIIKMVSCNSSSDDLAACVGSEVAHYHINSELLLNQAQVCRDANKCNGGILP